MERESLSVEARRRARRRKAHLSWKNIISARARAHHVSEAFSGFSVVVALYSILFHSDTMAHYEQKHLRTVSQVLVQYMRDPAGISSSGYINSDNAVLNILAPDIAEKKKQLLKPRKFIIIRHGGNESILAFLVPRLEGKVPYRGA